MAALTPRALSASNISPSSVFRTVDKWGPTLLVDEADSFARDNDELRGILNCGHDRSGAFVIRTVGDSHEPKQFCTWAPKAIAMIGKLPVTWQSRSIHIALKRMFPGDYVDPLRQVKPDTSILSNARLHDGRSITSMIYERPIRKSPKAYTGAPLITGAR